MPWCEGISAPALGNQSALAHNKDEFIRYAIEHRRQDTPMLAFDGKLSAADIDNVTAFIRSRASGWKAEKVVLSALPTPDQYVLTPENDDPDFTLADGMYVSSEDLFKAIQQKKKMVLLDTRVTSVWQRAHIKGAIPYPYYTELEGHLKDLPKDVQIVGYCSCPRAATEYVVEQLRELGYNQIAVLYKAFLVG
jgi:cytochrome c oxidase cbb3-type subunit 3